MSTTTIIRRALGLAAAGLALSLTACGTSETPADETTSTPAAEATDTAAADSSADGEATASDTAFTAPADDETGGKNKPVKIGVVGASGPQFEVLEADAEAEGIYLEFVDFTDYNQPNPAVASGELDLNQFQHIIYLAGYNVEDDETLVPIGSTAIYPLALYSKQYTSVAEIPEGAEITVPNDPTNQARALNVLASAGLLTLNEGVDSLYATPEDIDEAASKVKVTPVAADQTGRSLDDPNIAGAIINNDYVADSGLDPNSAIAQDDPNSDAALPFVNIWVTRAADQDNPVYTEIVRLASQDDFGQALKDNSGGTGVVVNVDKAKLQEVLANTEQQIRDNE
jgi:D-methionine transport system substrate-binding protein